MSLDLLGVKEIDSKTIEEQACKRLDEVYRLQLIQKKLERKVKNTQKTGTKTLELYNGFISTIKSIIDDKLSPVFSEDDSIENTCHHNYKLISSSKLQIGDDVIELSEDEEDALEESPSFDYETVKIGDTCTIKLGDGIYLPTDVFEKLYPHQQNGVVWLSNLHYRKNGGILADDLGLGKTITVLGFFNALIFSLEHMLLDMSGYLKVLLICPITLMNQWKNEVIKWVPKLKPYLYHSSMGTLKGITVFQKTKQKKHFILITSYETFRIHVVDFNTQQWSYVVLDEGQKIRNPDSAITLAVKTLGTPHRILLSGTPIQNNLVEFWSLLDFVAPGHLGTLPLFVEQFVDPIINTKNYSTASAAYNCALKLRNLILPFLQRNLKSNFADLLNLPKKTEHVLLCNLTSVQYCAYIDTIQTVFQLHSLKPSELSEKLKNSKQMLNSHFKSNRMLYLLTMLRKICNHPDLVLKEPPEDFGNVERSAKLMIAREIVEKWESEGHKVLIFSQTVQMLNIIYTCMKQKFSSKRIYRIDGSVSLKKRDKILEAFQNDESVFLLLLTTRVGGVGLNLTSSDRILIFDPDWNPMNDTQARERSYRIGQNRDVVIYRLIVAHTVEEKIYHRQIYKYFLSERILTDPRVINYRYLPASDLFQIPPNPTDQKKVSKSYMYKMQQQLRSMDFESEIRRINNTKTIYQNTEDIKNMDNGCDNNPLIQTIFAKHEIQGIINHDDIEHATLSALNESSCKIADTAVQILKQSQKERGAFDISVPTWTGKNGRAGAPINIKRRLLAGDSKYESSCVMNHLKKIQNGNCDSKSIASKKKYMSECIIKYFKEKKNYSSPTGDVIQYFAPLISDYENVAFKKALKQHCELIKVDHGPNYWILRPEFQK
ncbi:bifunctional Helicase superfamily 1-2 [Babesia duncani]|uniref:Bifunctional Helicase superfamily 1-2 n=1 Tax=Babesia duncani TaxID=323732 RepID=A0AAD9PIW3_9APIC|nr:bifunctional Helicase superfamily 1-2 [Babesia duncani]